MAAKKTKYGRFAGSWAVVGVLLGAGVALLGNLAASDAVAVLIAVVAGATLVPLLALVAIGFWVRWKELQRRRQRRIKRWRPRRVPPRGQSPHASDVAVGSW